MVRETQRPLGLAGTRDFAAAIEQVAGQLMPGCRVVIEAGDLKRGTALRALADVPQALPALTRAAKLGRRAARVGFDWTAAPEVRAKVLEEWAELDVALGLQAAAARDAAAVEEFGDLLFALVNWGRHLRIDAEAALRAANYKFECRFRYMEALARARNLQLQELAADAWEELWREAKGRPDTSA